MYLIKIYTEPSGLFKPKPVIEFKNGVNFIFGKKDKRKDSKKSLNGIGKSLFLDIIDFTLLGGLSKRISLAKKSGITKGYKSVLEFEVNNDTYVLKRSFDDPNREVEFGEIKKTKKYSGTQDIKDLKKELGKLIFGRDYKGVFNNYWFRKLMTFFIKIDSKSDIAFIDPVKYFPYATEVEAIQYHLFLMDIDNKLVHENYKMVQDLKEKGPTILSIGRFISDKYGYKNVEEVVDYLDKLALEINRIESLIKKFKVCAGYEDVEKDANVLTAKIKRLIKENYGNKRRLAEYKLSLEITDKIDIERIGELYGEVDTFIANRVSKSLKEVVAFRERLVKSREEFLGGLIETLSKTIEARLHEIRELDTKRAKLFSFLDNKEAISDLSEAYLRLSEKKKVMTELSGKVGLYRDIVEEEAQIKAELARLYADIIKFTAEIKGEISDFRKTFLETYNAIYSESRDRSKFILAPISSESKKQSKINLDIIFPSGLSKGRNRGRVLVYDLSILANSLKNEIKGPKFLIHDGVFDGMDKAHFVYMYNHLESLAQKYKFQYIITLNEEGTLNKKFGDTEKLSSENIERESIVTLTPYNKLFGVDF